MLWGATTQLIHILWLPSHPRKEGIHVFSGFFLISSGTITWNMHDGEPTNCMKFTNLHKKSRQNLRQQICRKAIKTRNGLGTLAQSDDKIKINSESQTFHRPSVDRPRPLTFDLILPNEAIIVFGLGTYDKTAPSDNKAPKGRMKYVSYYQSETLYWQFCWYLVPSKLTTHRHYRLLWTRSWSHKQSKLMWCLLSKKYKINWICLWTRRCCQSKRQQSRLQSWMALK